MHLKFEWDINKAATNLNKHGISFEEAVSVFKDPVALIFDDEWHSSDEEREIMDRMGDNDEYSIREVVTPENLVSARNVIQQIYVDPKIRDYVINIVFATREPENYGIADLKDLIEYGASPRASIYLLRAARAHAFLRHRGYVTPEDIKSIGLDVLRHRVIVTYEAEAEDISSEDVVQRIFDHVEVP